jgi:hypothetical protein
MKFLFAYPDADEKPSFDTNFDEAFVAKVYERAKHRAPFLAETTVSGKNAAPDFTKTRPTITRLLAAARLKIYIFATAFQDTA